MAKTDLTAQRLRELLHYNPDTGAFTWIVARGGVGAGKPACSSATKKHKQIQICKTPYCAHRLAWLYVYGEWPEHVDHINGNPTDNRIQNLRSVTHAINMQNQRKPQVDNALGFLGVSRHGPSFRASIRIAGKKTELGVFKTPELAHAAYLTAKRLHHPGCTI